MTRLRLEGLVVGRDRFRSPAIDLEARGGEVVALIGPNGAGKTTLLRTLAGLIPAQAGAVRIEPAAAAAYLPPPGVVAAGFSALHLAALGRAGRRGWSPRLGPADLVAAAAALERMGAGELAGRAFDRLSSGQQQLVLMARLLVQDAAVCLLDEPLALLDPANAVRVEAAVRTLAAEGRLVVASTHALPFARRCDRVLALGPDGATAGPPGEALRPERLAALYGVDPDLAGFAPG